MSDEEYVIYQYYTRSSLGHGGEENESSTSCIRCGDCVGDINKIQVQSDPESTKKLVDTLNSIPLNNNTSQVQSSEKVTNDYDHDEVVKGKTDDVVCSQEEGDCHEFEHSVAVRIFNFMTGKIKAHELFSGRLFTDTASSSDTSIAEHSIELNKRDHWMHLQKKFTKRFSNFEEFLSELVPSHLIRSGIIGWIVLAPRDFLLQEDFVWASEVYKEWKRLVAEKACVNLPLIWDLAEKHNIFSGKWMIFQPNDVHADLAWIRIARAHEEGKLGVAARISLKPLRKQNSSDQVIYVYNDDFRDEKTVFELEKNLRDTGIRCTMFYKPLVFTYCDIFSGNKWGMKAFIYMSTYDVENKSTIVHYD